MAIAILKHEPRGKDSIHTVAILEDQSQIDIVLPIEQATEQNIRAYILSHSVKEVDIKQALVSLPNSIDLTPDADLPPSKDQVLSLALAKVDRLKRFQAAGATSITSEDVTTAESALDAAWVAANGVKP